MAVEVLIHQGAQIIEAIHLLHALPLCLPCDYLLPCDFCHWYHTWAIGGLLDLLRTLLWWSRAKNILPAPSFPFAKTWWDVIFGSHCHNWSSSHQTCIFPEGCCCFSSRAPDNWNNWPALRPCFDSSVFSTGTFAYCHIWLRAAEALITLSQDVTAPQSKLFTQLVLLNCQTPLCLTPRLTRAHATSTQVLERCRKRKWRKACKQFCKQSDSGSPLTAAVWWVI